MRTKWYFVGVVAVFLAAVGRVGIAQESLAREKVSIQDVQKAMKGAGLAFSFAESELHRIIRGYEITPVRLNLRGKNLALVGLGSYLVNAGGGCNDCHTAPPYADGGDPFLGQPQRINTAGYLAGGVLFGPPGDPNTPVSRNLTPRESTGRPAGLTFEQFRETIRTGADLKHRPPSVPSAENDLLQVMPWPVYGNLSNRDLRAIYEYLRAIPSLPSPSQP